jgi:hypothetical protein
LPVAFGPHLLRLLRRAKLGGRSAFNLRTYLDGAKATKLMSTRSDGMPSNNTTRSYDLNISCGCVAVARTVRLPITALLFGPRLLLLYVPLFDLRANSNSDIVTRVDNLSDHQDKPTLLTRWPSARLESVGFRDQIQCVVILGRSFCVRGRYKRSADPSGANKRR